MQGSHETSKVLISAQTVFFQNLISIQLLYDISKLLGVHANSLLKGESFFPYPSVTTISRIHFIELRDDLHLLFYCNDNASLTMKGYANCYSNNKHGE